MNNPYFTTVGSYMTPVNPQEQQGLMPVFQNIAQQQQNQNAALAQQNQLVNQAGQTQQQGGMNPMAMAMALRGQKKEPGLGETTNSFGKVIKDPTYGSGNAYNSMTPGELANMQQYGV
jgi:hypothetical protein